MCQTLSYGDWISISKWHKREQNDFGVSYKTLERAVWFVFNLEGWKELLTAILSAKWTESACRMQTNRDKDWDGSSWCCLALKWEPFQDIPVNWSSKLPFCIIHTVLPSLPHSRILINTLDHTKLPPSTNLLAFGCIKDKTYLRLLDITISSLLKFFFVVFAHIWQFSFCFIVTFYIFRILAF